MELPADEEIPTDELVSEFLRRGSTLIPDDLIAEAITEAFGERCPDFEPECHCCKVWKQYDHLVSATERAAKVAEHRLELARTLAPKAAEAVFVALPDAIRSQP